MKVTFLGTGTSQGVPVIGCDCAICQSDDPRDKRLRCSIVISKNEKNILIDVGPDFRQQMLNNNIGNIHATLITHEHNDHVIGLDDIRPLNFMYRRNMPVYCMENVAEQLKLRFAYVFSANPYPGAPQVEIKLINGIDEIEVEGIKIRPIKVFHGRMPVLGFRVEDFTYITDAKTFPEEAIKKIEGTKVLVLNALHHNKHHSHLNLEEALDFINLIKPEKAYLTHCSHRMGKHNEVNKLLPSNVALAHDGLILKL